MRRGVLRERKTRILFLIPWTVYPALDPAPKRRLVERIRAAVLGDEDLDDRTAIAVAVAASTGVLKPLLGKQVLKDRQDRIEQITESQVIAAAVKAAADEAAAAAAIGAGG